MFKKLLIAATAALFGVVLGVANPGNAQAATSVYTQPGDHLVNGRYWRTDCEMYSTTVVRCSTDIWASAVVLYNGRYVAHDGWVFNNLTYLPSDRSAWAGNPLATNGDWVGADGRRWRTECDTERTGRGGCRSWAVTKTIQTDNGTFVAAKEWVINNIVQFSTSTIAPVTSVPAAAPAISGVPVEQPIAASLADTVVDVALSKVGSSYSYGSSGPTSFDCSGLTSWAYRQVGITLPRVSSSQFSAGTRVSRSALQPGDLVFYYSPISHVGIYIGDGKIVDAANPRTGVRVAGVDSMPFAGAVRVIS